MQMTVVATRIMGAAEKQLNSNKHILRHSMGAGRWRVINHTFIFLPFCASDTESSCGDALLSTNISMRAHTFSQMSCFCAATRNSHFGVFCLSPACHSGLLN